MNTGIHLQICNVTTKYPRDVLFFISSDLLGNMLRQTEMAFLRVSRFISPPACVLFIPTPNSPNGSQYVWHTISIPQYKTGSVQDLNGCNVGILKSLYEVAGLGALITTDPQWWISLLYLQSEGLQSLRGHCYVMFFCKLLQHLSSQQHNQESLLWLKNVSKHRNDCNSMMGQPISIALLNVCSQCQLSGV